MTTDYTIPPSQPPQQQKSSGCWKWGAFGCTIMVVLGLVGIVGLAVFVFAMMRSNDAYREALRRAQTNPEVIATLGTPIEPGWWMTGSVNVHDESGEARITFPIHGPRGKATVRAEATKAHGRWTYSDLRVQPENGRDIDLLAAVPLGGQNP